MSTSRPSFRETAAQRLAEGPAELPAAVEEFLSDTRRMAVRLLPLPSVALPDGADAAGSDADPGLGPLVESVRAHGVLEPILVRPLDAGRYEVVAGLRRVRAARLASVEAIPAVVRQFDEATAGALAAARETARPSANAAPAATTIAAATTTAAAAGTTAATSRPELVRLSEPVRIGDAPRPRRTTGTYMPPAVVTHREPIVISGPGIPGPGALAARRELEAEEAAAQRRAVGDDGDRRPRFRFTPFPFLRRSRSGSGEHR